MGGDGREEADGVGEVQGGVRPAVREGRVEAGAGAFDDAIPQFVELSRGVIGGRRELPVVVAVPVGALPRRADWRSGELDGERVVLAHAEVLEQSANGQRRSADPYPQSGRVEIIGLKPERRA